jgi:predicted transcriptional regulator
VTALLDAASREALAPSLMLGTARQAPPVERALGGLVDPAEPGSVLQALALLGQHGRFRRPAAAAPEIAPPRFADPRPILPEAARPLLRALFGAKGASVTDAVALAVADAIEVRRLGLHPFDLPFLDAFVKVHADRLGPGAAAWADRDAKAGEGEAWAFVEALDETNWQTARPAQKAGFIRDLRGRDPERARALVEQAWSGERAPVRVLLLKSLARGLSPADQPFLEALASDRAPSVREAAEALLGRLPGSPHAAKRLVAALARIKVTRTGILRRRAALEIDYPATLRDEQREAWAVAQFGPIPVGDMASGLDLRLEELEKAAAEDAVLASVLAVQATAAGRYDLLARLVEGGNALAWTATLQADEGEPPDAAAWSAAAIRPESWTSLPDASTLTRLRARLRRPLEPQTFEALLGAACWYGFLDRTEQEPRPAAAETISALAALAPSGMRQRLRRAIEKLPWNLTVRALTTLTLLDLIEAA